MSLPPNVYLFHPTCEMAIANGSVSWQPNRTLQQFETDLGTLPAFFARSTDIVLVKEPPSDAFIKRLQEKGFNVPAFLQVEKSLSDPSFIEQPKNELLPWGRSPVSLHKLKPLLPSCSTSFQSSPMAIWDNRYLYFYSRRFSYDVLFSLLQKANDADLISLEKIPAVCTSTDDICDAHAHWGKSMLKIPLSSSGRGVQPVFFPNLNSSILNWCKGAIKKQGYLMCEPLFDKVADFSFQFEIRGSSASYLGNTWFYTDEKGQYKGHYLKPVPEVYSTDITTLFYSKEKLLAEILRNELQQRLTGKYEGFLGVDAMIVRRDDGHLQIHPCLEINLRYNMGLLSMKLKEIFGNQYSTFNIAFVSELKKEEGDFVLTEIKPSTIYAAWLSKQ